MSRGTLPEQARTTGDLYEACETRSLHWLEHRRQAAEAAAEGRPDRTRTSCGPRGTKPGWAKNTNVSEVAARMDAPKRSGAAFRHSGGADQSTLVVDCMVTFREARQKMQTGALMSSIRNAFVHHHPQRLKKGRKSVQQENQSISRSQTGLKSRTAEQKVLLRTANKDKRLQFAQRHAGWIEQDWKKVIFTDESSFTTSWDQKTRIRRPDCTL
ncbi:hypothetical protein HPB50_016592 [Hyalomma asiaticum]|uniref:Uncharacterized protein n=1 Tax=Hyalomma asiaticum TaxID=266040 RepID=A0ACB7S1T6_HYAAI|nr:hypothetical protein HPB50_016592 [Hyalomma asiaticum]